ncbi:MAG TPA: cupin domain-containing protein [Polyangia bacterium]|nr:cupin domain-containing protein [Polyangia bacterium]
MTASGGTSPTIQHHVPDEGLLAHAAGTATEGAWLAMACHVALCAACAARLAEMEALGGALLETVGPAELPPDALASVLSRLSGPPEPKAAGRALPEVPDLLRPYGLPRVLRAVLGLEQAPVRWRLVIPGVRAINLPVGAPDDAVRVIAFKGGVTIPLHDHGGPEHIVVFSGALEEEGARFARGDISIREAGERHQQRVAPGEPCVALVVNEGKLKPLTLRGRILLALSRQ